nr:immunoglobulin heavy chain junction region [Macaca mulatta]MOX01910.1 immunoglobulin heavy chain junction region [Macaca mulatta]MOX03098.1 immunoglobulin heavy chain junction region [Macaca mulatta]MOX06892.1 immunoglobulin heavy chain junction region [Macaca mulatta]
CARDQSNYDFW